MPNVFARESNVHSTEALVLVTRESGVPMDQSERLLDRSFAGRSPSHEELERGRPIISSSVMMPHCSGECRRLVLEAAVWAAKISTCASL